MSYWPQFITMEYQVKVEYTGTQRDGQKWRSFMVLASKTVFSIYLYRWFMISKVGV